MILVSVGASQFPFDRLLHAVDSLPRGERLVVQHGPSAVRMRSAECVAFLPVQTLSTLIREARVVVTHAGVGSILISLINGKRPCVVPRLRAFGETVDDHQLASARRFARAGLVTLIEDADRLPEAVTEPNDDVVAPVGEGLLIHELRDYLEATVGKPVSKPS